MFFDDDKPDTLFVADDWESEIADVKPLNKQHPKPAEQPLDELEVDDLGADNFNNIAPPLGGHCERSAAISTSKLDLSELEIGAKAFEAATTTPQDLLMVEQNDTTAQVGKRSGIDEKTTKKLRRGELEPTARIDLHGFYMDDAYNATMKFLHQSAENGHRCVLLVTGKGKGYGETGNMGLIKAKMPEWLAHHPRVLAFHTAALKHGGIGAMYVLLRRKV